MDQKGRKLEGFAVAIPANRSNQSGMLVHICHSEVFHPHRSCYLAA